MMDAIKVDDGKIDEVRVDGAAEALKLENQLCFPLYAASNLLTRLYRPALDEIGLTYPQYLVMLVLWENDGQSVSEIGRRLYLDSGTLTPLLKRMEANGILSRQRDSADERRVVVSLTRAGDALRKAAAKVPAKMVSNPALTVQEGETLRTIARKLVTNLAAMPDLAKGK